MSRVWTETRQERKITAMPEVQVPIEISIWRARMWIWLCVFLSVFVGRERASRWSALGAWRFSRWRLKGHRRWSRLDPDVRALMSGGAE